MEDSSILGIDIGTSYSLAAIWKNGHAEIIPNDIGQSKTPSYVSFKDKEILVGESAKNQAKKNPNNTIFNILSLLGKDFEDDDLQKNIKSYPFTILKNKADGKAIIQVDYQNQKKYFYPEQILSKIFEKLKQNAIDYIGKEIKKVVLAVPSYFKKSQRDAMKNAARIAGLDVRRFIIDSGCASLSYGYDKIIDNKNVLILDLGGGKLEASIINISDFLFNVLAGNSSINLGGIYFDNKLIEYCLNEFKKKTSIDLKSNQKAIKRIEYYCEKAKIALSSANEFNIEIETLIKGED